ncbi:hypothetical protein XENTR_v10016424 [Xenopus tropicalis]|uniref:Novel protein n=1 Tax=Xenopus tropicalis TaxID=8364 RepID=Q28GE6_XENTR|nr:protein YAE1 homolog [Xenopus tropicalis]AAI57327.1 hypothetical protein LOC733572 [Xenopus tropicalis]KAE8597308.1 hypothetical protein XENTR_v10016424 [Xenopus tropicalis]CAJ82291.1 novel protein [Xenopus tropicalis]|eukprot:NP_001037945.1 protein YAE1 homolog [Xenopus tropicalis]
MAWVRTALEIQQLGGEAEVFDEDGDEMRLLQRDWQLSMEKRIKEGYVDGIEAGKENSLQTGFNFGYKVGVNLLKHYGELKGILSALLAWCQLHKTKDAASGKLHELLTSLDQCEEQIVKDLSSFYKGAQPSDLLHCVEDMALISHEHRCELNEPGSCAGSRNCCTSQDSNGSSTFRCMNTNYISDSTKEELCKIFKETLLVAEQLDISAELLYYIQTLNNTESPLIQLKC